MYIQTVFRLTEEKPSVSTSEIASTLGCSVFTVSEKVKHLTSEGYLEHEWREEVGLSEKKRISACKMLRKRHLIESFLFRFASCGLHEVHEEACKLEHVISERFADVFATVLGFPESDPYDHVIPSKESAMEQRNLTTLSETKDGKFVVIEALHATDPKLRKYISDMGLVPGASCKIRGKEGSVQRTCQGPRQRKEIAASTHSCFDYHNHAETPRHLNSRQQQNACR